MPSWSSLAGETSVSGVEAAGTAGVVVVGVEEDVGVAGADLLPQLAQRVTTDQAQRVNGLEFTLKTHGRRSRAADRRLDALEAGETRRKPHTCLGRVQQR